MLTLSPLEATLEHPADAGTYQYRRIVNVAEPTGPQDAATKNYVDTQIMNAELGGVDGVALSDKVNKVERRVNNLGAMQMSTSNALVQIPEGKRTAIGVGVGSYQNARAATVGIAHRLPGPLKNLQFSGNFTIANAGEKAGGMGIGYTF